MFRDLSADSAEAKNPVEVLPLLAFLSKPRVNIAKVDAAAQPDGDDGQDEGDPHRAWQAFQFVGGQMRRADQHHNDPRRNLPFEIAVAKGLVAAVLLFADHTAIFPLLTELSSIMAMLSDVLLGRCGFWNMETAVGLIGPVVRG